MDAATLVLAVMMALPPQSDMPVAAVYLDSYDLAADVTEGECNQLGTAMAQTLIASLPQCLMTRCVAAWHCDGVASDEPGEAT